MRVAVAALVTVGLLVAPATAAAQKGGPCVRDNDGPWQYQSRLNDLLAQSDDPNSGEGYAEISVHEALGAQFGGLWYSTPDQGWAVGVAPGSLTLAQAHDAIVAELGTRYAGDDLADLVRMLYVYAQLYPEGELRAIQDELTDQLLALDLGVGWTLGVGCEYDGADAWRLVVELFNDSTPEIVTRVQELIAPHGDRVRLVVRDTGPPEINDDSALTPRAFVRFARAGRCTRRATVRIRLRGRARQHVRRVTVTVAGHKHRVGRRGLTVRLNRKVTRVRVTVRLRSGQALRKTYTFRRC
jgi:hypothetical protein